jgi:tetratricopeptide (TPR) repeat protein
MLLEKVKTLRAAEKHLEMGKIPAAIKEYCKVAESDPEDFTTLNMLGDLYVRVGNKTAAIACFRRIADHYREQDFALKAIAMFKKIDRLQPNDNDIAINLAELYAQQGLVVEARAHYLAVAEAHSKAGATEQGLEVLRKIADLDPQNTNIRVKLGHSYLREGMTREAASCFAEAGQTMLSRGALDDALDAFTKSLDLHPEDHLSLQGLLATHSARGTADEAAERIADAVADRPDDLELLSLLVAAYVAAEDPVQAEAAAAALLAKEPATYQRYVDVARLYLTTDKIDDAVRLVALISEQLFAEREENQLLELVNELLVCDADNVQALRLLVRTYWWQRDMDNLKDALERLAEAAQAAGLVDQERYALTQLTRIAPDQTHHVERLNQLGGAAEDAVAEALPDFEASADQTEDSLADEAAHEPEVYAVSDDDVQFEHEGEINATVIGSPANYEMEIERGFTFEAVVAEELSSDVDETEQASAPDEARNALLRAQELESVDFYIAQGYADIALDTLDLLERQFGPHRDIELRRRQLAGEAIETPVKFDSSAATHGGSAHQSFGLSDMVFDPGAISSKTAPVQGGIDPGLAEIFEEYRASAESSAESNGDYETHYNLGLAYKEMDLFEEALEEFQIAVGLVKPGDGTPRYLQCCNLLGHCFIQKGVPQLAIKWFKKGFDSPGASEDERQALRYELAAAYELAGDLERALELFTEVYGINVTYRGVSERLRALQARINGESRVDAPRLDEARIN